MSSSALNAQQSSLQLGVGWHQAPQGEISTRNCYLHSGTPKRPSSREAGPERAGHSPPENEEGGGEEVSEGTHSTKRMAGISSFYGLERGFQNTGWVVFFLRKSVPPRVGWQCIYCSDSSPASSSLIRGKIPWWVVELGFYLAAGPDVDVQMTSGGLRVSSQNGFCHLNLFDLFQLGPDPSCGYRCCLFFFFLRLITVLWWVL